MTGWARVAALLILGHLLAPYAAVLAAVSVTVFVAAAAGLVWVLVSGRPMLAPIWRSRTAGTGGAQ